MGRMWQKGLTLLTAFNHNLFNETSRINIGFCSFSIFDWITVANTSYLRNSKRPVGYPGKSHCSGDPNSHVFPNFNLQGSRLRKIPRVKRSSLGMVECDGQTRPFISMEDANQFLWKGS